MTLTLNRRQALIGMGAVGAATAFGMPARAATRNLAVLHLASHAPSFIAYERGYYKEVGLDIDLKFFEAAQPMAVAIASGDADFGVTAMSGGLISLAQKDAVKVIGGALTEEKGTVGAIILASNKAYDAGLTDPSKLAGKSFGITTAGSSFHFMIHKIAQANNIKLSDIQLRPLQKLGAIVGALSTGQIDAWAIQPNVAKQMLREGAAKQIGLVSDYAPNYQVTTAFTSTKNAKNERELTEAFVKAYSKAIADYNAAFVDNKAADAERDDLAKIVHKYVESDSPFETAKQNLIDGAMRINNGLALSLGSCVEQLEWFKSEGMVKEAITNEQLFDTSYVKTI
ncbi:ABC transporter substrate-binding protein [Agrobacterium rhizogenes]|uniref:Nitrate/sulfonate/bicarbonate ABC transporter n=1 Tax=Rhizobium rhizogenes (strain K84 / ATCC BAA-868) TaxID=311403 RepID=B9JLB8_RHIR8|nr:ABC transporter substrate-binding protein [Rhizobium rhizogenes]ACM28617.1 nitrate/sulfonate/bicarbonate ABC transporter [Rhizobium rhizogenes K84]OCI95927.1 ABC transporter substrate-binding protein [Agrobacterium sp. 13-626]OCJ20410.1 ABC transporter substrate-binding protein [Agrobacterium sp. B131/95]OCJ23253.1 ABC transporter substrate-binding protein [Agrobacterium sp. B133/95]KEA08458.1 ABC transporter substrate-binding protein [Rhizobium rhizogenes]